MVRYLAVSIEDLGPSPVPGRDEAGERVPQGEELPDGLHGAQLAGGQAPPVHQQPVGAEQAGSPSTLTLLMELQECRALVEVDHGAGHL